MRANAVIAKHNEEAFDRPEMDQKVTVKGVDAGTNEGLVQKQEAPVVQDVSASGAGITELHESTFNFSSLREDGSNPANHSWFPKTKKGRKVARPINDVPLFGGEQTTIPSINKIGSAEAAT